MKKTSMILVFLVLILVGFLIYTFKIGKNTTEIHNQAIIQDSSHDGTYTIAGQKVTLQNGASEVPISTSSASKVITTYFGNDLKHDINDDGIVDDVFVVTQDQGGSGLFYYVVALLHTPHGDEGSEGLLLGDRIAPQTINIDEGRTTNGTNRQNVVVVNYADRKPGESFAIAPSIGKSIWLKFDPKTMQFGIVEQNFEG